MRYVLPAIFDAEVSSALVRGGTSPALSAAFLATDLAARRLITIGPRASLGVVAVVHATKLRAADAAYVWVASSRGLVLVTLDQEIGRRVAGLCLVEPP